MEMGHVDYSVINSCLRSKQLSEEVIRLYEKLKKDAEAAGYHLHPNEEVVLDIVEGLVKNTERYGYPSCPWRLASGEYEKDVDIKGKEYVRKERKGEEVVVSGMGIAYPVWRCKVCGYLCARDAPAGACPICKARDRWERLIWPFIFCSFLCSCSPAGAHGRSRRTGCQCPGFPPRPPSQSLPPRCHRYLESGMPRLAHPCTVQWREFP